uniref:DUF3741 domain-containing protein n=1 Tax=Setaria digitata TaxID=48799 RepID=A0A915Q6I9_9BILA
MAILYGELQLLMKNAENLKSFGEINECNSNLKSRNDSQNDSVKKLDAVLNESKDGKLEELKMRSYSRSKSNDDAEVVALDGKYQNWKKIFQPNHVIDMSTNLVNQTAPTIECNISSSNPRTESEDGDSEEQLTSVISWIESPNISEKFRGSASYHNVHHRRRSSQVAEQVWRLRHKQQAQDNNDNEISTEKKLSLAKTEVLPKKEMALRISKGSQSTALNRTVEGFDHRCSIARQRTPLTVEQCAELDEELDSNLGVVKKMIKQLEKPRTLIASHQHAI